MSIPQTVYKAQATGNDFVLYCDPLGEYAPTEREIVQLCDRHFGIGADGLIRLTRPEYVADLDAETVERLNAGGAKWFMDYRNADGSLAEMCGNGTRATALFASSQAGVAVMPQGARWLLGTRAGIKALGSLGAVPGLGGHVFRVDMGAWSMGSDGTPGHPGAVDEYTVTLGGSGQAKGTFVDMGNPHVVAVIEDAFSSLPVVEDLDLSAAPIVEPALENGQNVEFVRVDEISPAEDCGEATMRVFERGCGETLSCGTGLCATAITLRAKTGVDHWTINIRGGVVRVDVADDEVSLTGDAELVGAVQLL